MCEILANSIRSLNLVSITIILSVFIILCGNTRNPTSQVVGELRDNTPSTVPGTEPPEMDRQSTGTLILALGLGGCVSLDKTCDFSEPPLAYF